MFDEINLISIIVKIVFLLFVFVCISFILVDKQDLEKIKFISITPEKINKNISNYIKYNIKLDNKTINIDIKDIIEKSFEKDKSEIESNLVYKVYSKLIRGFKIIWIFI
jgi:hypothetical protein